MVAHDCNLSIWGWRTGGSLGFTSCHTRLFQTNKVESSGGDTQCPLLYTYMQRVYTNTDMGVGVAR